jgi:hypothetical protein
MKPCLENEKAVTLSQGTPGGITSTDTSLMIFLGHMTNTRCRLMNASYCTRSMPQAGSPRTHAAALTRGRACPSCLQVPALSWRHACLPAGWHPAVPSVKALLPSWGHWRAPGAHAHSAERHLPDSMVCIKVNYATRGHGNGKSTTRHSASQPLSHAFGTFGDISQDA